MQDEINCALSGWISGNAGLTSQLHHYRTAEREKCWLLEPRHTEVKIHLNVQTAHMQMSGLRGKQSSLWTFERTKTLDLWKTAVSPPTSAFSGCYEVRSLFDICSSFIPVKGSRSVWPVVGACFVVPLGLNSHKSIYIYQKSPKSLREHVFWSAFSTYPTRHLHSYESPLLIQTCWQLFPCAHASEPETRRCTNQNEADTPSEFAGTEEVSYVSTFSDRRSTRIPLDTGKRTSPRC